MMTRRKHTRQAVLMLSALAMASCWARAPRRMKLRPRQPVPLRNRHRSLLKPPRPGVRFGEPGLDCEHRGATNRNVACGRFRQWLDCGLAGSQCGAEVGGLRLERVLIEVGDNVRRAVIAVLRQDSIRSDVALSKAALARPETMLARSAGQCRPCPLAATD